LLGDGLTVGESLTDLENRAWLGRVTAGWKKAELPLEVVRRYWRDVHSPAIARRDGLWEYRHYQFDAVDAEIASAVEGVRFDCPADAQLMWLSDVRYASEAALADFARSPSDKAVLGSLLADIDLIVERSTTYRAVETNAWTYVDRSQSLPQGVPERPHFGLFFRRRTDEASFRTAMREMSAAWSIRPGVRRLRLALLDAPDAEAERKAGYPIKTHPAEQQYQAWIDIMFESEADVAAAIGSSATLLAEHVTTLHAYPVAACYTSNHGGRPTLVGLRGFPAFDATRALGARNQLDPALLAWMYGRAAAETSFA
jgi:hypothetical protein